MPGKHYTVRGVNVAHTNPLARRFTAVWALWFTIALGVVLRLYRLNAPLVDAHFYRQTQTASQVWMWDRFGFTPLEYRVPTYGGGHWVLEFPWYQWLVYLLTSVFGFHEALGRIVSIAAFVVSAYLLFAIGRRLLGSNGAAVAAVAVFAFLPLTVFYYRAFLIDPTLLAVALLMFLAALKIGEHFAWRWICVLIATGFVLALGKANLLVVFGLPVLLLLWRAFRAGALPRRAGAAIVAGGVITLGALALWTRYADSLNAESSGLTFSAMRDWYFGSTLFETGLWVTMAQRFIDIATPVGIVLAGIGLGAVLALNGGRRGIIIALIVSNVASMAIFANLNRVHDYYQLPYFITFSLLAGLGIWTLAAVLGRARGDTRHFAAGILAATTVLWITALFTTGYFRPEALEMGLVGQGSELRDQTPDAQVLAIMPGTPDPNEVTMLYQARRTGWRLPDSDEAQARAVIRKANDLGAVAIYKDAASGAPAPAWVEPLARSAGMSLTYDTSGLTVYSRTANRERGRG